MIKFLHKWPLAMRVILVVIIIMAIKMLAHFAGIEVISLNTLFSGLVAANVFLMGFLLSGVLSDYKESEKIPSELATSLEAIHDEASIVWKTKSEEAAKICMDRIVLLGESIIEWLYKRLSTDEVLTQIKDLNDSFVSLEKFIPVQFISRMKVEQTNIRRMVTRIKTIRETSFVSLGYAIATIMTVILSIGLILAKIESYYESFFFVGAITYLLCFMLLLIQDLDNPFGFYEKSSSEDVSLKPIEDFLKRMGKPEEGK
jgi:hypothetical protein